MYFTKIKRNIAIIREDIKYYIFSYMYKRKRVQENKILFNNFMCRGFGDNPKYIAEEIMRQKLPYQLVWIIQKGDTTNVPRGIRTVKVGSREEANEYATSKIIISNVKNRKPFFKKKDQYYIQTWHGSFAFKRIEKEIENILSKRYTKQSQLDSSITDVMLSGCGYISNVMRNYFWYSGEIFECGQPRDDIYFNHTDKDVAIIREKYKIPVGIKVAVYAPTFRDNMDMSVYSSFDTQLFLDSLKKRFGGRWILLVRFHPNVSKKESPIQFNNTILDFTNVTDGQEVFLCSDLLVTDYSSVCMDFTLMNKPVFLFIPDCVEYTKGRGFNHLFDIVPYPHCKTNKELKEAIMSYDEHKYKENIDFFMDKHYHNFSDGHASERVVERIKQVIDGTFKPCKTTN